MDLRGVPPARAPLADMRAELTDDEKDVDEAELNARLAPLESFMSNHVKNTNLGLYQDLMEQPLAMYYWASNKWLPLLATEWKTLPPDKFEVTLRTSDPGSVLSRRFGTVTMQTSLRARSPNLGQYPCTSCHLGSRTEMAEERIPDAHRNVVAVHPVQTGGACATCHAPDNVELLALRSGERATLDLVAEGRTAMLTVQGDWVRFWGFEVTCS